MIADPNRLGALVGADWTADCPQSACGNTPCAVVVL
jgi:hypothetical protein